MDKELRSHIFARINVLSLLTLLITVSAASADTWKVSKLTRFGVSISHPTSLVRQKAVWEEEGFRGSISALNADTLTDGGMNVFVEGVPFFDRSMFDGRWSSDLARYGSRIGYKVRKSNWYVVSGVASDGDEFYIKVWHLPGNRGFFFAATYPHAMNAIYDKVLERMLKDFVPVFTDG